MNKVLVFDISGDYAFFKKNYTTMSPLSFSIPPRTVICGIMGAIIGADKEKNPELFNKSFVSVRLLNKIKKTRIPINLLKTTSASHFSRFTDHKPTIIEFLKDLKLRVYFYSENNEIYNKLKNCLQNHKSHYTICLGISELLADYEYIGEADIEEKTSKDFVEIASVIPKNDIEEIRISDYSIFTAVLPNKMLNTREVIDFKEFVFEKNAKMLPVKIHTHYLVSYKKGIGENIVPM